MPCCSWKSGILCPQSKSGWKCISQLRLCVLRCSCAWLACGSCPTSISSICCVAVSAVVCSLASFRIRVLRWRHARTCSWFLVARLSALIHDFQPWIRWNVYRKSLNGRRVKSTSWVVSIRCRGMMATSAYYVISVVMTSCYTINTL